MKKLFLIDDSLENKISYWHILFFVASLPFDRFYSEIVLISFSIHTLLHFNIKHCRKLLNKEMLILQSVFILTILGTFYSTNKPQALDDATRQLSIFILPLIFCLAKINISKYQSQLLFIFSLVCTFTTAYLYADAIHTIHYYKLPFSSLLSSAFDNHNFSQPIDIHATYFSMYAALSLAFMLQQVIEKKEKVQKILFGLCCIILAAGLIQLSSKSVFFAVLIILNVAFPFLLFKRKGRLKYIGVSSICSILIIALLFNTGLFKERFFNNAKADLSSKKSEETTVEPRVERWEAALEIIKQSPVSGHGSGTEIMLLKEQYFSKKMYSSYLNELNAHNQYISLLIKTGCVGLLIYFYSLFVGLKQAVTKRNIFFLSFMILVATVSVSENILDVNKGIFFYSFFFSFFVFNVSKPLAPAEKVETVLY